MYVTRTPSPTHTNTHAQGVHALEHNIIVLECVIIKDSYVGIRVYRVW